MRRRLLHLQQTRFQITLMLADDLDPHGLPDRDERDENHPTVIQATHAATAERDLVDGQPQDHSHHGHATLRSASRRVDGSQRA